MRLVVIHLEQGDPIVHAEDCRNARIDGERHINEVVIADSLAQIAAYLFQDRLAHEGLPATEEAAAPFAYALQVRPCVPLEVFS